MPISKSKGRILDKEVLKIDFFNWKVYTETVIQFIHLIRVLAEAMNLIYKRKGRFILSKIGKEYLENTPLLFNAKIWFWRTGRK